MRVALASDCAPPTPNGVSELIATLMGGLAEQGHRPALVAPQPRRPPPTRGVRRRTRTTAANVPGRIAPRGGGPDDLALVSLPFVPSIRLRLAPVPVASVQRWLHASGAQVVHTHTEGPVGWAARQAARRAGLPLVHTLHTFYAHYLHYLHLPGPTHQRWIAHLEQVLATFLRPYNHLIAPSPAAAALLGRLAPHVPTEVVRNAVVLNAPRASDAQATALRRRFGLAEHRSLVLVVGRVAPEKRSTQLLAALAPALRRRDDVEVVFVGAGPLLTRLRRAVARAGLATRIRFVGILPHPEVLGLLGLSSLMLSASLSDNDPLTVLEAGAAGVPCAVREDHTGIVIDGVSGIVADDDDTLIARSLALLDDGPRRAALATAARAAVAARSVEAHVDRTLGVYLDAGTRTGNAPSRQHGSTGGCPTR